MYHNYLARARSKTTVFFSAMLLLSLSVTPHPAMGGIETISSTFITLGTNSGPIPNPQRAEPANYINYGSANILVDAGDGVASIFGFLGQRYQTRNRS